MKRSLFSMCIISISIFANEVVIIDDTMYQNQSFSKKVELTDKEKFGPNFLDTIVKKSRNMNWAMAKEYCKDLEYKGFSDWRLPTHQELEKMSRVNIYYGLGDYQNFDDYAKQHIEKAKAHFMSIKPHRHKSKIGSELIIKDEFLEHMPLINDRHVLGEFWVSDERDANYAMTLDFRNAVAWWTTKDRKAYVLCTRKK